MAVTHQGAVLQQLDRLFTAGTVAGLTEGQLLERFVSRRDEAAFAALVARHGPMVLAVCRRVLRDEHAAEDAFQAAFLVLVRKAASLQQSELLANWLYGVACRVAVRARTDSVRRRGRERSGTDQLPELAGHGVCQERHCDLELDVHEELMRLPGMLRSPVILCYLQGQTHEEAARQLRWPVGTVRSRLARARKLLRGRLTRRGLVLPAGLVLSVLNAHSTSATVPPALMESTVAAAMHFTTPGAAAGTVSAAVVALTEGALKAMTLAKIKVAAITLTTFGALAMGAGVLAYQEGSGLEPAPARANVQVPAPPSGHEAAPQPPPAAPGPPPTSQPRGGLSTPLPPTPSVPATPAPTPPPAALPGSTNVSLNAPHVPGQPVPPPPPASLAPTLAPAPVLPAATAPPEPPPVRQPTPVENLLSVVRDNENPGNVQDYLERTRKDVDAAIARLNAQIERLEAQLEADRASLRRLEALKAVLDKDAQAEAPGPAPGRERINATQPSQTTPGQQAPQTKIRHIETEIDRLTKELERLRGTARGQQYP